MLDNSYLLMHMHLQMMTKSRFCVFQYDDHLQSNATSSRPAAVSSPSTPSSDRFLSKATEEFENEGEGADEEEDEEEKDAIKPAYTSDDYYGTSKAHSKDLVKSFATKSTGDFGESLSAGGGGSGEKPGDDFGSYTSLGSTAGAVTTTSGNENDPSFGSNTDTDDFDSSFASTGKTSQGFSKNLSAGSTAEKDDFGSSLESTGKPSENLGNNSSLGSTQKQTQNFVFVRKSNEEPAKSFAEKPSDDLKNSNTKKSTYRPKVRIFSKSKRQKK